MDINNINLIEFEKFKNLINLRLTGNEFDNIVSLWDLVNTIYKVYKKYKEEYQELDKMGFKILDYFYFGKQVYETGSFRSLRMVAIDQVINNHEEPDVVISELVIEDNYVYKSYIESEMKNPYLNGYFCEEINLDNEKIKNMLDFFEKYDSLFKIFRSLYANKSSIIFNYDGNLDCQNLEKFKFCFGDSAYFYYFVLCLIFEDKLNILENDSYFMRDDKKYTLDKDNIIRLLKEFYVNKKYFDGIDELEQLANDISNENKVKIK